MARRFAAAAQRLDAVLLLSVLHWIGDHREFLATLGPITGRFLIEQPDPREDGAGVDRIRREIGPIGDYLRRAVSAAAGAMSRTSAQPPRLALAARRCGWWASRPTGRPSRRGGWTSTRCWTSRPAGRRGDGGTEAARAARAEAGESCEALGHAVHSAGPEWGRSGLPPAAGDPGACGVHTPPASLSSPAADGRRGAAEMATRRAAPMNSDRQPRRIRTGNLWVLWSISRPRYMRLRGEPLPAAHQLPRN